MWLTSEKHIDTIVYSNTDSSGNLTYPDCPETCLSEVTNNDYLAYTTT